MGWHPCCCAPDDEWEIGNCLLCTDDDGPGAFEVTFTGWVEVAGRCGTCESYYNDTFILERASGTIVVCNWRKYTTVCDIKRITLTVSQSLFDPVKLTVTAETLSPYYYWYLWQIDYGPEVNNTPDCLTFDNDVVPYWGARAGSYRQCQHTVGVDCTISSL